MRQRRADGLLVRTDVIIAGAGGSRAAVVVVVAAGSAVAAAIAIVMLRRTVCGVTTAKQMGLVRMRGTVWQQQQVVAAARA